jgi:molybdopterin biosynthesis enzyme MoaB
MEIHAGILAIGTLDEETVNRIARMLRQHLPDMQLRLTQAVGSQRHWIADLLMRWCDEEELDLVITLGGTLPAPGPSGEEIVPEATDDILERAMPGLVEAMRAHAALETRLALIDRGVAGIRGRTLILNLPEGRATPMLFLAGVVDLLPALLDHLAPERVGRTAEDELVIVEDAAHVENKVEGSGPKGSLDAAEFEAFRQRRQSG